MALTMKLSKNGQFHIEDVTSLSYTYFPLCNFEGMRSAITPTLGGDAKSDQNSFILVPATAEDLAHSLFKRHVYFRINDQFTWSITGQTPTQILKPDQVDLKGDFLTHEIIRKNDLFTSRIESFVPTAMPHRELHKITFTNTHKEPLTVKPVVGVPLFGRSADNIRDHRHVTALLNRVKIVENGVINQPTFSFDERGHVLNQRHYGVFAQTSPTLKQTATYPTLEGFIGEGGSLLDPLAVKDDPSSAVQIGDVIEGYEAVAGMTYPSLKLEPGASFSMVLMIAISDDEEDLTKESQALTSAHFDALKKDTQTAWQKTLSNLTFHFADDALSGWLKWVTLQPVLRRLYGNSFLPFHDYGRGGRGWRDLWQDLLGLILMEPEPVRAMILNNFKGVRIDGSNATIIGEEPGQFLADRNKITRIWMDHGCWPLLTVKLYLDQSGDVDLLFEKVSYFHDQFTHYTKKTTASFDASKPRLKTQQGKLYEGTVFEHLLIQNLVPFYNVGQHNIMRLEDADWNDGLDMASKHGESVAFTAFYAQNLVMLADLLLELDKQGIKDIALCTELDGLLESVPFEEIRTKQATLQRYFDRVQNGVSGDHTHYKPNKLAAILQEKGTALLKHIREHEWLEDGVNGWFNGYYDNDGKPLDDINKKHMTLTGQVFAIMSGAATDKQTMKTIQAGDQLLYDKTVGGYRLNTNFKEVKTNMGRLFGFAYGHKENGAMFSHMAVMYAYALYKRGFVSAGYKVLRTIFEHSLDIKHAKIYPGIPEYFDPNGRGLYPYLTGSASWMILTMVTEVFGIKGHLGLPVFEPKLLAEQFGDSTTLSIETLIGSNLVNVVIENPLRLSYGDYTIQKVHVDEQDIPFTRTTFGVQLKNPINRQRVVLVLGH